MGRRLLIYIIFGQNINYIDRYLSYFIYLFIFYYIIAISIVTFLFNQKNSKTQQMGNCNQFCNPDQNSSLPDHNVKHGQPTSQIVAQQFILKCQICGQDRQHTKFRDHLDLCHFVNVQEKSGVAVEVVCLICNFKTNSLQLHMSHVRQVHSYMDSITKKNIDQQHKDHTIEKNQSIKKRIKAVSKPQFVLNSDGIAIVRNQKCNMNCFEKQYGALEFDEQRATGDIVWRYAFGDLHDTIYYYVEFTAKQKSIIATSKLFTKLPNKA